MKYLALLWIGLLIPGLSACLVSPLADDLSRVSLALELPGADLAAEKAENPFDKWGLFHLEDFPKHVRVEVWTADYLLQSATWPDPERGIGAGEGSEGEVDVELEVPAGQDRRLHVLGIVQELGRVLYFKEEEVQTLDLVAGRTEDLSVQLLRHETGRVEVSARCQSGNQGLWQPVRVSLVDARAAVVFPPSPLKEDPFTQALEAGLDGIPVGRPFWARVFLESRTTGTTRYMDLPVPTFSVKAPNDKTPVTLVLPCYML